MSNGNHDDDVTSSLRMVYSSTNKGAVLTRLSNRYCRTGTEWKNMSLVLRTVLISPSGPHKNLGPPPPHETYPSPVRGKYILSDWTPCSNTFLILLTLFLITGTAIASQFFVTCIGRCRCVSGSVSSSAAASGSMNVREAYISVICLPTSRLCAATLVAVFIL